MGIFMKKTLIALALTSSTVISGSVMAWDTNTTTGTVNLSGTLTPANNINPWEVKIGTGVTGLNANIQKNQKIVNLVRDDSIEILGIRTSEKKAFVGVQGIIPQISYGNAIDATKFSNGETLLTLVVKDNTNTEIGKLESSLFAQAFTSEKKGTDVAKVFPVYSPKAGSAYYGGLGTSVNAISTVAQVSSYMPDAEDNWVDQGGNTVAPEYSYFRSADKTYNSYYFSVIKPNQNIKLTLNNNVSVGDAPINWTASLPITVSYQ